MTEEAICIFGAGAIGLDLAGNLLSCGRTVTIIARGASYEALQSKGLGWVDGKGREVRFSPERFKLFLTTKEAGLHKYIFLTTNVEALIEIAAEVESLLRDDSVVLSATNGIPPWYSLFQNETLERFSFSHGPRNCFSLHIPPKHILGVVLERSSQMQSPGNVKRASGKGFTLGELNHRSTQRCVAVQELFTETELTVTISSNIHRDIWIKLIGNVAVNPLSVLTEQTIGQMLLSSAIVDRMRAVIAETKSVGVRLGLIQETDFSEEAFFSFMKHQLAGHRTSMLQNFVDQKPLEIHRMIEVVEMLASAPGPISAVAVTALTSLSRELKGKVMGNKKQIPSAPARGI